MKLSRKSGGKLKSSSPKSGMEARLRVSEKLLCLFGGKEDMGEKKEREAKFLPSKPRVRYIGKPTLDSLVKDGVYQVGPDAAAAFEEPRVLGVIEGMALEGAMVADVEKALGLKEGDLSIAQRVLPQVREAFAQGGEVADTKVKISLFRRAIGYEYVEYVKERVFEYDADGKVIGSRLETVRETLRHFPPDVGAICFWLKNRLPNEWRDRRDLELSGAIGVKRLEEYF